MIPAVILAAGASSRMGRAKALLPLPDAVPFLLRVESTLRSAGLDEIVAVVGRDAAAIRATALDPAARSAAGLDAGDAFAPRIVENPDPSRGQLSSLLTGLAAVLAHASHAHRPAPPAVLVTIVDLPLVSADTVRRVVSAWESSRAPVVRPTDGRRHGHPVIFSAALFDELRAADPDSGARVVVHAHAAAAVDVLVNDPGAFDDVDTPDEYRRLLWRGASAPRDGGPEGPPHT